MRFSVRCEDRTVAKKVQQKTTGGNVNRQLVAKKPEMAKMYNAA